jgi:fluoroacetyl-CoA thioesterase
VSYPSAVPITTGLRGVVELVVADADTAIAMRSGDVPALATPRVVALVEEASREALVGCLGADQTTVSMRVQIDHLQPTGLDGRVTAEAVLDRIDGRRLSFTVHVNDRRGLVAAGRVTRVIVNTADFLHKLG